jgi:hypothetical protein
MNAPQSSASLETNSTTPAKLTWLQTFKVYTEAPTLRMLTLGFSAGLPLLLVLGTLSFWLREAGVNRATIGHLSWVGLAAGRPHAHSHPHASDGAQAQLVVVLPSGHHGGYCGHGF